MAGECRSNAGGGPVAWQASAGRMPVERRSHGRRGPVECRWSAAGMAGTLGRQISFQGDHGNLCRSKKHLSGTFGNGFLYKRKRNLFSAAQSFFERQRLLVSL